MKWWLCFSHYCCHFFTRRQRSQQSRRLQGDIRLSLKIDRSVTRGSVKISRKRNAGRASSNDNSFIHRIFNVLLWTDKKPTKDLQRNNWVIISVKCKAICLKWTIFAHKIPTAFRRRIRPKAALICWIWPAIRMAPTTGLFRTQADYRRWSKSKVHFLSFSDLSWILVHLVCETSKCVVTNWIVIHGIPGGVSHRIGKSVESDSACNRFSAVHWMMCRLNC